MRYGSVCSGVEAASLAWMPLGWECVFVSEVEPFPCAVLQQRFGATAPIHPLEPEEAADEKDRKMRIAWMKQNAKLKKEGKIPNEGDFTKIGKKYAGKIDLLVGGTPCQDLSVAGKREGFNGKRSSLAIDFVRLAYESQCKWFVWENVPGVFSSNGGRDFATLLSLFTGCEVGVPEQGFGNAGFVCNARRDRFGVAWRVLDAQFTRVPGFPFAIPQRRRRVFVVGYFGDWTKAAEVCLEPYRLSWDTPPRIKTREIFAGNTATDAGMAGGEFQIDNGKGRESDVSCTLDVKCKDGAIRNQAGMAVVETGKGFYSPSDCAGTLESNEDQHRRNIICAGFMGGQGAKAGGIGFGEQTSPTIKASPSGGNQIPDVVLSLAAAQAGELGCIGENISQTLSRNNGGFSYIAAVKNGETQKILRVGDKMMSQYGEVAGTLEARHDSSPCADRGQNIVCYENHAQDSRIKPVEVSQSIVARMGTGGGNLPLVKEPDVIGFIKNDAGGVQQGFWKNAFPTLRAAITPAITWNECFQLSFCDANGTRKDRKNGGLYVTKAETSQMVTTKGPHTDTVVIALDGDKMAKAERKGGSGLGVSEDGVMYTQTVKDVHAVAYDECVPLDLRNATRDPEKHDAQNRQGVGVGEDGAPMNTVTAASVPGVGWQATVRKLLPIECERLMGFPDNWTRISWKGKPEEECPDAPRYKACGNSMCVNVMAWIGCRIELTEREMNR